jgi:WhiB family redox-sensing transcriptional regulator
VILLHVMNDEDTQRAACRGTDPELFFDSRRSARAKQICAICPVRDACLEAALTVELFEHVQQLDEGRGGAIRNHGVYGGWTADERKPLIYRRAARKQAS